MQKIIDLAFLAVVVATVGSIAVAAQQGAQLYDSQYSDVDVAHGASLYAAHCATFHGAQGDAIGSAMLSDTSRLSEGLGGGRVRQGQNRGCSSRGTKAEHHGEPPSRARV
jgi:mono/diheme cytochrome c family protein